VGGARRSGLVHTEGTSTKTSGGMTLIGFILLEVYLRKPAALNVLSPVSCLSPVGCHVHTSGTKPAICLMWFLVIIP